MKKNMMIHPEGGVFMSNRMTGFKAIVVSSDCIVKFHYGEQIDRHDVENFLLWSGLTKKPDYSSSRNYSFIPPELL